MSGEHFLPVRLPAKFPAVSSWTPLLHAECPKARLRLFEISLDRRAGPTWWLILQRVSPFRGRSELAPPPSRLFVLLRLRLCAACAPAKQGVLNLNWISCFPVPRNGRIRKSWFTASLT